MNIDNGLWMLTCLKNPKNLNSVSKNPRISSLGCECVRFDDDDNQLMAVVMVMMVVLVVI